MPARIPHVLLAVIATAFAVSGCSPAEESVRDESGAIAEENENASVFDMAVGDCFNEPGDASTEEVEEIETLPAVPCSQDHDYEVYESQKIAGEEFPGDKAVEGEADQVCLDAFETYVGLPYDDSTLDMTYLYPTSDSWMGGDREITCLAFDPEALVSGTLEGSKR